MLARHLHERKELLQVFQNVTEVNPQLKFYRDDYQHEEAESLEDAFCFAASTNLKMVLENARASQVH